jgi:curved DNA-binding protein CbpA
MIAYTVLGLKVTNNDAEIRQAYLESLKKYPPEKSPDAYQIIRKAYELIETEQKRLDYYLFKTTEDISFDEYSAICLNLDKTLPTEKWNTLCRLYQESRLNKESESCSKKKP